MAGTRNWREVRTERPLNEARVEAHRRLMEAEEAIAAALVKRGVSDAQIEAAIAAADAGAADAGAADTGASTGGQDADPYLAPLTRYVTALGGRLELRAVFPNVEVNVLPADVGDR